MSVIYTREDELQYWKDEVVSQKALTFAMRMKIQALKAQREELLAAAKNAALDLRGTPDGVALDVAIANAEKDKP